MSSSKKILEYWFASPGHPEFGTKREFWFGSGSRSGPDIDAEIDLRFGAVYRDGLSGALDGWRAAPETCLALILLFDQFPRNMFRGEAAAYATDDRALALARLAADRGDRDGMMAVQQLFLALPFEHSEDLADQRRALALFEAIPDATIRDGAVESANKHMAIIARFGRFPHRNAILGRQSTAAEAEFLAENAELHFGARKWSER